MTIEKVADDKLSKEIPVESNPKKKSSFLNYITEPIDIKLPRFLWLSIGYLIILGFLKTF